MRIDYPRSARSGPRRYVYVPSWRQLLALLGAGFALLLVTFGVVYAVIDVPDPNPDLEKAATIVYYDDGRTELGRFAELNRVPEPADQVPAHVRDAVLAAEDRDFYDNRGVSPRGMLRALVNNARGGSMQGGSTITQQYVKNAHLTHERTLQRKAKEFVLALKVDQQLDKDEILANYLNGIYWGRNAYGLQAAAQAYFGKPVGRLTVSEGAFLAGIIQAPGRYEPTKNREGAQRRWAYVLDGMVSQGWLSGPERDRLRFPRVQARSREQRLGGPKGYLLEEVRRELLRRGFTEEEVEAGGLRVRSTFNRKAQDAAVRAATEQFPRRNAERVRVGLAAVRPGDGAVVAMYGGPDFVTHSLNAATQSRVMIGSTYKPFTLAAALQNGRSLKSRYAGNSPLQLPGGDKPVRNEFDQDYGERIDLYEALAQSVNTAFVDLTLDVGPTRVRDAGLAAGLDAGVQGLHGDARVTLGSADASPLVLANAYATIAARGTRVDTYTVAEVRGGNGGVRLRTKPKQRDDVFGPDSDQVTADVIDAMRGVVENGTGRAARALGRPAAGKTGTAAVEGTDPETGERRSYNVSAWFAGFTPQLSTAVAFYRDGVTRPTPPPAEITLDGVGGMETFFGSGYPTRTWTAFMSGALRGERVLGFPAPARMGRVVNPSSAPTPTPTTVPPTTVPPTTVPPTTVPPTTVPPTTVPPTTAAPTTPTPTSPSATPTSPPPTTPSWPSWRPTGTREPSPGPTRTRRPRPTLTRSPGAGGGPA